MFRVGDSRQLVHARIRRRLAALAALAALAPDAQVPSTEGRRGQHESAPARVSLLDEGLKTQPDSACSTLVDSNSWLAQTGPTGVVLSFLVFF